ncbi:unnamed protein product [Darwinula stevensoni]|uniref:Uncharacterized protein n=1 Tax=Darwinula stevensoni TaxID=69355 RepID=A0A7R9AE88_9CRUS|nr:unnamed protein product [Darwinula stevensoni]CAG0902097.1 unnamed protein product [Darwinula stevensoni]
MQLNETNALETLNGLTSGMQSEENLSGDEIETIVEFLGPLLDAFLDGLEGGLGDSSDPLEFLRSLTVAVDLTLDAFQGWLDIATGNRSVTFSSLTETMARAGLEVAFFMLERFEVELAFNMSRKHLVVEAWGKPKDSGSFVFPNGRGHTYAVLPDGFQDQLGGGVHYFVVGVLYSVDDLNELLPGDRASFGGKKRTNSLVLSLAVRNDRPLELHDPLRLTFRNEEPASDPPYREVWRELHEGERPTFAKRSHRCTFWNVEDEHWDDEGCRAVSSNRDETVCECGHLTNFAVLMDLHSYVGRSTALEASTISLSCLSIVGLVLALVTFFTTDAKFVLAFGRFQISIVPFCPRFPAYVEQKRGQVESAGVEQTPVPLPPGGASVPSPPDGPTILPFLSGCAASGVVLHYLFLSAFTWMALEGMFVYRQLVRVFPTGVNIPVWTYLLAGYGLPGLVVLVTKAVSFLTDARGYGDGELYDFTFSCRPKQCGTSMAALGILCSCWLSSPHYIWAFAGPVLVIVVANTIFMILALRNATGSGNVGRSVRRQSRSVRFRLESLRLYRYAFLALMRELAVDAALHSGNIFKFSRPSYYRDPDIGARRFVKSTFTLTCLLGIGWIFGFFYMEVTPVFAYVFTILNASQARPLGRLEHALRRGVGEGMLTAKAATDSGDASGPVPATLVTPQSS